MWEVWRPGKVVQVGQAFIHLPTLQSASIMQSSFASLTVGVIFFKMWENSALS